jgi:site-specific recombinase XerC
MLFDWLVVGHLLDTNPAHAVRGPKHSIKKGKTPMLTAEEARTLLNSIPVTRMVKRRGSEEQELPYITGYVIGL